MVCHFMLPSEIEIDTLNRELPNNCKLGTYTVVDIRSEKMIMKQCYEYADRETVRHWIGGE